MSISKMADIHPDAIIGKDVTIESFAKIDKDVIIGDGTWIGTGACVYPGARIGKRCRIFPGAVIAGIPQDLKFRGEYSVVEIGDHTTIREYVTVNRGTASKGITKVGSNTLIMAYCHIGHDSEIGSNCVLSNSVQIAGEVIVEDWVVIGGMSAVHQFCRIGTHAMVSGMTGILSDVTPYTKVFGIPAKHIGINSIGLRRRGFSRQQIESIHAAYRILFQSEMNISQAIEYITMVQDASEEMIKIVDFISNSQRGIIKGGNSSAGSEKELQKA